MAQMMILYMIIIRCWVKLNTYYMYSLTRLNDELHVCVCLSVQEHRTRILDHAEQVKQLQDAMRVKEGELQDVRNLVTGIGKVGARMGESVSAGGGVVVKSTTRPVGSHGGGGLFMQSVKVRARRTKVHRSVARNVSSDGNDDRSNSNDNGNNSISSSSSSSSGGSNNRSAHSNGRNSNRPRRPSINRPRAASMSPFDVIDEEEWHQRCAFTPSRSYSDPATPLDATTEEAGGGYPGGGSGRGGTRGVEGGGRRSLSPAAAETKYRDVGPPSSTSSPSLSPSSPATRSPSSTSAPSSAIAGIALPHSLPLLNTIDDSGSKRVLEL